MTIQHKVGDVKKHRKIKGGNNRGQGGKGPGMGALPGGVPLHHGRHGAILHGGLPQSPGGAIPGQRGEDQGELPAHARQRNQLQGLPLV